MASTKHAGSRTPVCSKPKLQGAFPLHSRKIFTSHLLSKLFCMCTTPLHSRLTMGQLYLSFEELSITFEFFSYNQFLFKSCKIPSVILLACDSIAWAVCVKILYFALLTSSSAISVSRILDSSAVVFSHVFLL